MDGSKRHPEAGARRRRAAHGAVAATLGVLLAGQHAAATTAGGLLATRGIAIDSTPAGAAVYVIGGKAGVTPLTITERDIYPNTYPEDRAQMYGKVFIKKPGCADYSRRLTLEDIDRGVHARLECATAAMELPAQAGATGEQTPAGGGTAAQRRLEQIRVLQELLDDGILSADEERGIRRRILDVR